MIREMRGKQMLYIPANIGDDVSSCMSRVRPSAVYFFMRCRSICRSSWSSCDAEAGGEEDEIEEVSDGGGCCCGICCCCGCAGPELR